MKKNVLIRYSIIFGLLVLLTIILCMFKQRKSCLFTKILNNSELNNSLLIQDSLIMNTDSVKTIVYFGYKKNKNDSLKWNDIIEIYQIKNNDTILNNNFTFFRQIYEGIVLLIGQSYIPNEKIYPLSFIVYTAISKGNFSENFFTYDIELKKYFYEKRINYMEYFAQDTIGLKTVFFIENKYVIDSTEMKKLFNYEKRIYEGEFFENSEWIIQPY